MLKIVDKLTDLEIPKLKMVYAERILAVRYDISDFLNGLRDFFRIKDAVYCIRIHNDEYVCALRLEPYRDGRVISWLETSRDNRGQGHAKALIADVLSWSKDNGSLPIYAHVHKDNKASLRVFLDNGFAVTGKPAVFLDGSVSSFYHTLVYKDNPTA